MEDKTQLNWRDVLFCSGPLRIKLIKAVDYFLGSALCAGLRPQAAASPNLDSDSVRRILVIRPGGIGDAVLLVPFIKELKKLFPAAKIDVLCEKRNAEVFKIEEGLVNILALRNIFREKYDIVFDTEQWHNFSALISYFSRCPCRVGFDTRKSRSKFYTHLAPYSREEYEAVNFLNLLKPFSSGADIKYADPPFISLPLSAQRQENTVALCLSAGVPERRWPEQNFQKLIAYLSKKGYNILLLEGNKKRLSLPQAAALLAASSLYIGLDSGLLHLAYALGVPTVSLFGPGVKDKWAPRGMGHKAISKNLACSPCTLFGYTPRCRKPKCMELITPEDVIAAIEEQ